MTKLKIFFSALLALCLTACTSQVQAQKTNKPLVKHTSTLNAIDTYQLNGKTYTTTPKASTTNHYEKQGKASYYANRFNGRRTASGEVYRSTELTAAHKTLPFGTRVLVTNLKNNRKVIVKINDRGPFHKSRIIDLSGAAAKELGIIASGVGTVKVEKLHLVRNN